MFGFKKIDGLDMSMAKLNKRIVESAGCSVIEARNRIKAVVNNGGSVQYCLENDLFELTSKELMRFFRGTSLRLYVGNIAKEKNVKAIDVYRQMRHAKSEYGISYAHFYKFDLFGSDEKTLAHLKESKDKRIAESIQRIAEQLDISYEDAEKEALRIQNKFSISPENFYKRGLYGKSDEEVALFLQKRRAKKDEEVSEIAEMAGRTPKEIRKDINRCYASFGITKSSYKILRCYELDDELLTTYGSLRDSKILTKHYNDSKARNVLRNKIRFNNYYKEYLHRKFWINQNTDFDQFSRFAEGLKEVFCKPVNGLQGRGVKIISLDNRNLKDLYDEFMAEPKMLFEEKAEQHHEIDEFYDRCANTLRLFTILDDDEFFAFAAFMRFGAKGSSVDNLVSGGVGCGVDIETGTICTPAMTKEGEFIHEHPDSHKVFEGFKIPNWDIALELAEQALRKHPKLNYIGWDLAIRENDVAIIEGNSLPALDTCQELFNYAKIGIKPQYQRFLDKCK